MTNQDTLDTLFQTVTDRKSADPHTSYTAALYAKGRQKIAQKIGEEGVETALAAVSGDRQAIIAESADLLFHLWVLLADAGITPSQIMQELERRIGQSGLDEKRMRKE